MYFLIGTRSARARSGIIITILLLLFSLLPLGEFSTPTALAVGPVQYWPWIGEHTCNGTGYHWDPGAKGLDFGLDHEPLFASGAGVVHIIYTQSPDVPTGRYGKFSNGGWGNEVVIKHADGYYSRYAHMSQVFVTIGQSVVAGTPIGISGNSGNTSNPHLHYEVYQNGSSTVTDPNLDPAHSVEPGPISGYNNPSSGAEFCIAYPKLVNHAFGAVQLFLDQGYGGNTTMLLNPLTNNSGYYNLESYANGQFLGKVSSIAIPSDWTVKLYKNADKSGGAGAVKTLYAEDKTLTDDLYGDGTPVNDHVSSVEVFVNACVAGTQQRSQTVAWISVAEAVCGSPPPTQLPNVDGIQLNAVSPITVEPNHTFTPSVTIKVTSGSLTTGVDLHATPDTANNTFGAWPQQGVHYTVSTGNTYTFSVPEHAQFVMTAPAQTGSYQSTWRLRKNGADFGPTIVIPITVATVQHQHPIDYWDATYYASKDLSGSVAYQTTFTDQYIFKDWGIGSPASGIPVDNWSARFVREINFPGGDYHFHCQHDDGCRVLIDGTTKLDAWWDSSFDGHDWTGTLTAGFHEVKVEFYDQGGGAHIDMWWQGPGFLPRYPSCEPDQWCADYWGNKSVAGSPALTKNEGTSTFLNTGWGTGGPGYNLPTDYFSARVTRTLPFTCGTYRFHVTADDADRFYVDGSLVLDEWTTKAQPTTDIDVQLSSGDHTLTLDYREDTGQTALQLSWDQIMACAPYSGSLTVSSGQTLYANTIQTAATASGTSATVGSSTGFDNGDTVLFHQTQGTNAGKWELNTIASMSGNAWTLTNALANSYSGKAQVLKVPHYTSVTIQNGATLTALPWNGTTGGVLAFQSDGTVTVNGTIDMNGKGYRGGAGSRRADGHSGQQGESYTNIGATCSTNGCNVKANNGGGGGSGGVFASGSGGGSGAGFASAGTNAPTGASIPGNLYGATTPGTLFMGSGGGSGYEDGAGAVAGNGGNGGGLIMIIAPTVTVNGTVTAQGAGGVTTTSYGGGGGSGGSVYVEATTATFGTNKVLATGGPAGNSGGAASGGVGGTGRIYLVSCNAPSGTTNPAVNVQNTCSTGTNLALNGDTGESSHNGTNTSSKVNDGNMSTRWESVQGHDPEWVGVDLGSVKTFNRVKLYWETAYATNYTIQVSNDTNNWSTIYTVTGSDGGLDDLTLSGTGRYVRMNGTARATQWGYSIYEFEVYNGSGGGSPTPTPVPPTPTPVPPTPTPGAGTELLVDGPIHLEGNNGAAEDTQGLSPTALQGKTSLLVTYNLHGLTALGGDASALIIEQNGWHYVSLSNYGQNGLNGSQTVTIPLSAFSGLNLGANVEQLHFRFWYSSQYAVDITSVKAQ